MFERPAVWPWAIDRAQQLVEQIAVAVLDVDEVEACVRGERGRIGVGLHERIEVVIRQFHGRVGRDALVQHGVVVRDTWLRRADPVATSVPSG